MKKSLKVLSTALVLAMAVTAMAGCGNSNSGSASTDAATTAAEAAGSGTEAETKKATDYPKMAITINTSKSGSAVDYGARAFAKVLGEKLGNNVIVNSTSGQVEAIRETINSDPDGYTLGFTNNTVIINDVSGSTDFDSIEDVKIAGIMAQSISSWIGLRKGMADELGISTFEDLIKYTQEHPDELTISDSPNSSTNACIRLLREAGLLATSVSAGTGTDRLTALLSGACDIYVGNYGYLEQYIQTGEVVCLVSCSEERSSFSPDVPCTYELGYEVTFPVYYYITAPKDTPDEVIAVLNDAMKEVSEDESYVTDLKGNSNEPFYMDSAEGTEYLTNQKKALLEMGMDQQ